MRINNGVQNYDFPNFNYGYKTEIIFPFETSELGNKKISIRDYGTYYDKYRCRGKLILTETEVQNIYTIYNNTPRSSSVTLSECINSGFFPFSPAVAETSFTVYLDDIKNNGMVDEVGKLFEVELTFLWEFPESGGASNISWNNPLSYCKEGSLTFANITDMNYPNGGFKIKKGYDVVHQNYKGNKFYGVDFNNPTTQWNQAEFELRLRQNLTSNLIYNLVNTYRNNTILIEGAENYYIFGEDQGDSTQFSVKLNENVISIKHDAYDSFRITFDVVKI